MSIETSDNPQAFTDFEHQGWEVVANKYNQYFTRLTNQSSAAILDAVMVTANTQILDVCTGPGVIAATAVERGARVTGIDFSAEVIQQARSSVTGAEFQEGDAMALSFEDNSFDAVVCGFGIIHVPDPRKALLEMHRVVKLGGRIAVSVWGKPSPDNGFGLLFGSIKAHGDLNVPLPHGPDFFQFSEDESMAAALQDTGLSKTSTQIVENIWELSDATEIVNAFMHAAVRARGMLMAQTDPVRQTIVEAVKAGMEQFKSPDGQYRVFSFTRRS